MTETLRIAIVGFGKIARDQHVPAIGRALGMELVATASPEGSLEGVPAFPSLEAMLEAGIGVDAVAICTPPQHRRAVAATALAAGLHVLLEKPPGATVSEVAPLVAQAASAGLTLFAAWHSRFAPAADPARAFLAERRIDAVTIEWNEDVRRWHPKQEWIWQPGGLGVFDPGINALSLATYILPQPIFLTASTLSVPANCATPIAAQLRFADARNTPISVGFDWRQTGEQTWHIEVDTDRGRLVVQKGGKRLEHDGACLLDAADAEYDGIYRHFARLIAAGDSDVDLTPLAHVADAFLLGRNVAVEDFVDDGRYAGGD